MEKIDNSSDLIPFHIIEINNEIISTELLASIKRRVIFLESAHGTGKTTAINNLFKNSDSFVAIANRKSTAIEQAQKGVMTCYLDQYVKPLEKNGRVSVCCPSTYKIKFQADNLFIDEADKTFNELITGTYIKTQGENISAIKRLAKKCKKVIFTSADMVPELAQKIVDLCGIDYKEVTYIKNEYKLLNGKSFRRLEQSADVKMEINEAIKQGFRVLVPTDSKAEAERLKIYIKRYKNKARVLLITSKTAHSKNQQDFIANPAAMADKWDVVIYTPAIASGIHIPEGKFDVVIGHFIFIKLAPKDVRQMLLRLRGKAPIFLFMRSYREKRKDMDEWVEQKYHHNKIDDDLAGFGNLLDYNQNLLFNDDVQIGNLFIYFKDQHNKERSDCVINLIELCERLGMIYEDEKPSTLTKKQASEINSVCKMLWEEETAKDIMEAQDVTESEYKKLQTKLYQTEAEYNTIEKHYFFKEIPCRYKGIQKQMTILKDYLRNKKFIYNLQSANATPQEKRNKLIEEANNRQKHIFNRRNVVFWATYYNAVLHLARVLIRLPSYDIETSEIKQFLDKWQRRPFSTETENTISFVNESIKKINLKAKYKGKNQEDENRYRIDKDSVAHLKEIHDLRKIAGARDITGVIFNEYL